MHKYDEGLQTLRKIRQIPANSISLKARLFTRSYNLEIDLYISTGQFNNGVSNLPSIENELEKYVGHIQNQHRLGLYYNLAYLHFGAGKFNAALDWINQLLNDPDLKSREDIHSFGQILNLFIHYELGNDKLLEYIVKSTYRFLMKRKRLYKVESVILRFLKKFPNWITNKQILEGFRELKEELQALAEDEFEKRAFEYFDFISWLESKIQGAGFEEIVQGKKLARSGEE